MSERKDAEARVTPEKKKFSRNPRTVKVGAEPQGSPSGTRRAAASVAHERSKTTTKRRPAIIREPAVVRRLEQASAMQKITSNGTIAAAVMVVAALLAVAAANSQFYEFFLEALEAPIGAVLGPFSIQLTFEQFINDFLMAVFFLLVGIELKYETTVGQLRKPRQAMLPMLAAVGGVAAPAIIYMAFNMGGAG